MEKPSKKLLEDVTTARQIPAKLLAHSMELEQLLQPPVTGDWDWKVEKDFLARWCQTKVKIKDILGFDLDVKFLYKYDASATLEAKAYCSELVHIGLSLIDKPFTFSLQVALFKGLNIIGYLSDRGPENFFICEPELEAFLNKLELFLSHLSDDQRSFFVKAVLQGRLDRIGELRRSLKEKHSMVQDPKTLEPLRAVCVDDWIQMP